MDANGCSFCIPQIKFLRHVTNSEVLLPDTDGVEAILSYRPTGNAKQLRRIPAICNFHQQFIPNYAHFVSPLLILLKKGQNWKRTGDLQKAFELLRDRLATVLNWFTVTVNQNMSPIQTPVPEPSAVC